jgi:hypothetical protein
MRNFEQMAAMRFLTGLVIACFATSLLAQEEIKFSATAVSKWRIGIVVKATSPATNVVGTMPVPMDWPEQSVKLIEEDVSPEVKKLTYRELDGGVKQMVMQIPKLLAGQEARAVLTFEVTKKYIEAPDELTGYQIPPKAPKGYEKCLLPSPFIESNDAKIRALAKELGANEPDPWKKAEIYFDWVRSHVRYQFAEEIKPAVAALKDGVGDCEELSSLFIALCRAEKIPARAVWVPGHTYPEFYLEDGAGQGRWFPCQAAGEAHDFGRMPESRPILQKGDNFRVPEERGAQRYIKPLLRAGNAKTNPEVDFVLEPVRAN